MLQLYTFNENFQSDVMFYYVMLRYDTPGVVKDFNFINLQESRSKAKPSHFLFMTIP